MRPPAPHIPRQADERTTLLAFLDYYRAALVDRCYGLDHDQLQRAPTASSLTLSRLVGHMAYVEYIWFRDRLDDRGIPEPYASMDWDADPDAEMTRAQTLSVAELFAEFNTAVAEADTRIAAADSLDQLSIRPHPSGEHWSLRWILVHMIEEYARHAGHADLIREGIDGDVL